MYGFFGSVNPTAGVPTIPLICAALYLCASLVTVIGTVRPPPVNASSPTPLVEPNPPGVDGVKDFIVVWISIFDRQSFRTFKFILYFLPPPPPIGPGTDRPAPMRSPPP